MNHSHHTFEADTIVDALNQVRTTLGPEAVILETRRVKPRLPGFGRDKVQVKAALQDNSSKKIAELIAELRELRGEVGRMSGPAAAPRAAARARSAGPAARAAGKPRRSPLAARAAAAGLSREGVRALERQLDGSSPDADALARLLAPGIRTLDPLAQPGVILLAGTTGVGKTTTLAKMAARFYLDGERGAALISKDAYRIGAMDQLRCYAELLGIPFEAAFTPEDLGRSLAAHADKYAVFVDTAGRSPSDAEQLAELGRLTENIPGCRVLLTISLAQAHDAAAIMKSFSPLKPCGLVVTKLDESGLLWGLQDILRVTALPLAFTTSGQRVPEDIERAEPAAVARLLALRLMEGA